MGGYREAAGGSSTRAFGSIQEMCLIRGKQKTLYNALISTLLHAREVKQNQT